MHILHEITRSIDQNLSRVDQMFVGLRMSWRMSWSRYCTKCLLAQIVEKKNIVMVGGEQTVFDPDKWDCVVKTNRYPCRGFFKQV